MIAWCHIWCQVAWAFFTKISRQKRLFRAKTAEQPFFMDVLFDPALFWSYLHITKKDHVSVQETWCWVYLSDSIHFAPSSIRFLFRRVITYFDNPKIGYFRLHRSDNGSTWIICVPGNHKKAASLRRWSGSEAALFFGGFWNDQSDLPGLRFDRIPETIRR